METGACGRRRSQGNVTCGVRTRAQRSAERGPRPWAQPELQPSQTQATVGLSSACPGGTGLTVFLLLAGFRPRLCVVLFCFEQKETGSCLGSTFYPSSHAKVVKWVGGLRDSQGARLALPARPSSVNKGSRDAVLGVQIHRSCKGFLNRER